VATSAHRTPCLTASCRGGTVVGMPSTVSGQQQGCPGKPASGVVQQYTPVLLSVGRAGRCASRVSGTRVPCRAVRRGGRPHGAIRPGRLVVDFQLPGSEAAVRPSCGTRGELAAARGGEAPTPAPCRRSRGGCGGARRRGASTATRGARRWVLDTLASPQPAKPRGNACAAMTAPRRCRRRRARPADGGARGHREEAGFWPWHQARPVRCAGENTLAQIGTTFDQQS
jgi:hypothetical protein